METRPHALCVEAVLPSAYFSLAIENFLHFHFASWEHNASSAGTVPSRPAAKVRKGDGNAKERDCFFVSDSPNLVNFS